jgi:CO dehydrogenase maturation factor
MSTTIAISGKGGSGKTTLAAMLIRYLLESCHGRAILAVDADPNSCLGKELGVEPAGTIAEIREQTRSKSPGTGGMDRVHSFEYDIQQIITEASGFDLLTMGRPEGPGCYCAANNILRTFLDKLSSQYEFVIIDNEAGMEHLSRRTTNNVDLLCIVAEQTSLGAVTAQRISKLAKELPISVKEIGVIWNNKLPIVDCKLQIENRKSKIENIETLGYVPFDQLVFDASMQGKTVFELEGSSPAFLAVRDIFEQKLTVKH